MPSTYFDSSVIGNLFIARDTYAQQVQSSVLYQLCVCTLHGMCISPGFLFIQQDTTLLIKLRLISMLWSTLVGTLVPTRKLVFMIVNKIMWAVQKLLVYLTYAHIHKRLCKCLGMFRGFGAGLPTMWSLITLWVWECMMDLHLAESILLM